MSRSFEVPSAGRVVRRNDVLPGRDSEVRASAELTGGSLAVYRSHLDGEGPPLHQHRHEDETIIVHEGSLEVTCGDEVHAIGPGDLAFLPRGVPHTFRSIDGPCTFLLLVTPGHLDEFFRLRDEAIARDAGREEMIALAREFF